MPFIKKLTFIILLLILNLIYESNSLLWARGGGGCLIEGTSINTPNGKIPVENIKQGDHVLAWNGQNIIYSKVIKVLKTTADEYIELTTSHGIIRTTYAYNLIVEPPATFLANDIVVHNKGCFLPDTEILLSDSRRIPISQIKVGDNLAAFTLEGNIVAAPVKEIITAQSDSYYEITTDRTIINVTAEHPLYIGRQKNFKRDYSL
ncbi:MAG: hypothetical protein HZC10_02915 [Nitrospirae bacterium]|nr:hypothetical protein [Nitrospirota bacterium]